MRERDGAQSVRSIFRIKKKRRAPFRVGERLKTQKPVCICMQPALPCDPAERVRRARAHHQIESETMAEKNPEIRTLPCKPHIRHELPIKTSKKI